MAWTKPLAAWQMVVADSGRIHFPAFDGVQSGIARVEPTGTELSLMHAGLMSPQRIGTDGNAVLAVQYPGGRTAGTPTVLRISAADTVEWTRSFPDTGRCFEANVLRATHDIVVIAGGEGSPRPEDGSCDWATENLWLAAIDPADGRILWSQVTRVDTPDTDSVSVSDVAVLADRIIVTGSFGWKAFGRDGTELWSHAQVRVPGYAYAVAALSSSRLFMLFYARVALVDGADGALLDLSIALPDGHGRAIVEGDGTDATLYMIRAVCLDRCISYQPTVSAYRWSAGTD